MSWWKKLFGKGARSGTRGTSQRVTLTVDLNDATPSQREEFDAAMRQQGWQGSYRKKETDWSKFIGQFPPQAAESLIQSSTENAVAAATQTAGLAGIPKYKVT